MHGVSSMQVERGAPVSHPVVVGGVEVGRVGLRFPSSHLPTPQAQIRDALSRNVLLGAGLAVLSAVVVAVFVARQVSRPLNALTAAAVELESGRRDVRVDLPDAPGELGTLASAFDRMAASVERQDELRRRLVADVAHEVRTPLTILRGTTEALVDGVVEPDPATLGSVHEEVLRLTRLVTDLETLAAADAASLQLDPQPVDLATIAGATADLASPTADAAGLELLTELAPAPVVADAARVRQIATTLLANALAYTPSGGTITVRTWIDGDAAHLEVADTGPGVDPADQAHLFERFYRGRRTADVAGSGIGLSVAKELVEAHGGTIAVRSAPGEGTTFTVRLPTDHRPQPR
jgi:two-component system, OmpR family, sensor histidine kinase BaeS